MSKRNSQEMVQFSIRIPAELKQQIDSRVEELDLDLTTWIRHAIREKLERDSNKDYSNVISAKEVYAMIERAIRERDVAAISEKNTAEHNHKCRVLG